MHFAFGGLEQQRKPARLTAGARRLSGRTRRGGSVHLHGDGRSDHGGSVKGRQIYKQGSLMRDGGDDSADPTLDGGGSLLVAWQTMAVA